MSTGKFKKAWLNYWYHHKFGTIVGGILVLIGIFTLIQQFTREKYDLTIYLYTSSSLTASHEAALSDAVSRYCDDFDKNGSVKVSVMNFSFDPITTDAQTAANKVQAIYAQLALAENYIIFSDEKRYNELNEEGVLAKNELMTAPDGKAYLIKNTAFGETLDECLKLRQLPGEAMPELYLSLRKFPAENSDKDEQYIRAEKTVRRISVGKMSE